MTCCDCTTISSNNRNITTITTYIIQTSFTLMHIKLSVLVVQQGVIRSYQNGWGQLLGVLNTMYQD